MQNEFIASPVQESVLVKAPVRISDLDYSLLLKNNGLSYKQAGYYWQVGEITKVQGWILYLSVIPMQIGKLISLLAPMLQEAAIPFKLIQDKDTATDILYGNLGYQLMGQVIGIYPQDDKTILELAKKLVKLTETFRGTAIPTGLHLGGIVYARYGGHSPVLTAGANGEEEEYIYDGAGKLIKDPYSMPFSLPEDISWPFAELAVPVVAPKPKILKDKYKPLSIMKTDTRGNVMKGIYLKSLFQVRTCVIKVGKKNMLADVIGRDIQDRLLWQEELQRKLEGVVPLPKVIDLFTVDGDMYLVMEFIKGVNLYDRIVEINNRHKTFFQLSASERSLLLDYLFQILSVIAKLHERGYVHRDIAPGNFLIDSRNRIILIDMELSYRLSNEQFPLPFELGTEGFMSPEQEAVRVPTVKEDIYGLGALMVVIFTALSPVRFNTSDRKTLPDNLAFFIGHQGLAHLIARCLEKDASARPDLTEIIQAMERYRKDWESDAPSQLQPLQGTANGQTLAHVIQNALNALSKDPMPISKGRWMSKSQSKNRKEGAFQKEYSAYAGLHTGMGGVLYLLARAKMNGFTIDGAMKNYQASWDYIESKYLTGDSPLPPGLFHGKAGIALALAQGLKAGLLEDTTIRRQLIMGCFTADNDILNVTDGLSGQGIAMLQCDDYLEDAVLDSSLRRIIEYILDEQQRDGSWLNPLGKVGKRKPLSISFSYGVTGIVWFLFAYQAKFPDPRVREAAEKALDWLLKKTDHGKIFFNLRAYRQLVPEGEERGDERTGFIQLFIKAYEVLSNSIYRHAAESVLTQYPAFAVNNNFSQDGGLAGLGELYTEAGLVFGNVEWKKRAASIAHVFVHLQMPVRHGGCYWLMDETDIPAADLLTGNSGIIHFLLRNQNPDKVGYILLN